MIKIGKIFKIYPLSHQFLNTNVLANSFTFPIEEQDEDNIDTMIETLRDSSKDLVSLGMAGPQVGYMKPIILIGDLSRKNPLSRIKILLNPVFVQKSERTELSEELCLSQPNIVAHVKRHYSVKLHHYNLMGQLMESFFEGQNSFLIQHEMNHLQGVNILNVASHIEENQEYVEKQQ